MKPILLGIIIALLGVACGTTEQPQAQGPKYKTFSIAPLPGGASSSDPAASSLLNDTLKSAIVEGLTSKGYSNATPSIPDFTVKVHTEFYNDIIGKSEQRSLSIGFFDTVNNREIWRATRGRSSPYSLDPDDLRKGVLTMLESVPEVKSR